MKKYKHFVGVMLTQEQHDILQHFLERMKISYSQTIRNAVEQYETKGRKIDRPGLQAARRRIHQIHMLLKLGKGVKEIARIFEVNTTCIGKIKRGENYNEIYKLFWKGVENR